MFLNTKGFLPPLPPLFRHFLKLFLYAKTPTKAPEMV